MSSVKIAIFMSGPVRFAGLVRRNLEKRLAGVDHEFFYHLWLDDLSNKVRQGYQSDPAELQADPKTKVLLFHRPYSISFFERSIGTQVNTHSTVNAVVGMFLGIGQLCQVFRTLPDRKDYTHILRVRTDCAILAPDFLQMLPLDASTVMLGQDNGLPAEWASDHLLFAPAELFLRIYDFTSVGQFYEAFAKGRRNPEKILKHLLDSRLPAGVRVVTTAVRFRDYQIVYLPAREGEQPWIMSLLQQGRIEDLFLEPEKYNRPEENAALLAEGLAVAPKTDPYRNRLITVLRSLRRRWRG